MYPPPRKIIGESNALTQFAKSMQAHFFQSHEHSAMSSYAPLTQNNDTLLKNIIDSCPIFTWLFSHKSGSYWLY
ncbi:hypothetical protein CBW46_017765 [Paenibacillus xerothermodurans]|uniref:Uncharacterized protein n=1 Tax=Paenibacillus xerothermodurans TaxID=1977292 RepID=A0A2W1NP95_PAEXE|nr:hypothetical protein CBW46_017765 [Paenibacillus xerothermodurans]